MLYQSILFLYEMLTLLGRPTIKITFQYFNFQHDRTTTKLFGFQRGELWPCHLWHKKQDSCILHLAPQPRWQCRCCRLHVVHQQILQPDKWFLIKWMSASIIYGAADCCLLVLYLTVEIQSYSCVNCFLMLLFWQFIVEGLMPEKTLKFVDVIFIIIVYWKCFFVNKK